MFENIITGAASAAAMPRTPWHILPDGGESFAKGLEHRFCRISPFCSASLLL
jgi:hypothetical protein